MKKERTVYLDYIRVLATIAIVVLHVTAWNWSYVDARSVTWNTFNFYNGCVRWAVPAFLMISGALFLRKDIEIKVIYSKYILRLVVIYIVWAAFYAWIVPLIKLILEPGYELPYKTILYDMIGGAVHMWFLPMIIGIYMCIPIIRLIVKDQKTAVYFLILAMIFSCLIPTFVNLSNDFGGGMYGEIVNRINGVVSNVEVDMILGYVSYFVLGYVLSNIVMTQRQRAVVQILGAAGFLGTVLLDAVVAWKTQTPCSTYYDSFSVNVACQAAAVFVYFQYRSYPNEKLNAAVAKLSEYSFGVYLVHVIIIDMLYIVGIDTLRFLPAVSVPVISAAVAAVSYVFSAVVHRIPVLKKWIV